MTSTRLAVVSLAVATGAGAVGLGWLPLELGESARTATVLLSLAGLGGFAASFLAGLDGRPLLRGTSVEPSGDRERQSGPWRRL